MGLWPNITLPVNDWSEWLGISGALLAFVVGDRFVRYLDRIKGRLNKALIEKRRKVEVELQQLHKSADEIKAKPPPRSQQDADALRAIDTQKFYLERQLQKYNKRLSNFLSLSEITLDIKFWWLSILSLIICSSLMFSIRVRGNFITEFIGGKEILFYNEPILYPLFFYLLGLGVFFILMANRRALYIMLQVSLLLLKG